MNGMVDIVNVSKKYQLLGNLGILEAVLREAKFLAGNFLEGSEFISGMWKLWHCKNISFLPEMKTHVLSSTLQLFTISLRSS